MREGRPAGRLAAPLFSTSGGLVYHLRAWRYGKGLWRPFHVTVHGWLEHWHPRAEHLVLVGPSGGYALEKSFLQRFERLTVLEPDRLARRLLQRRFPAAPFEFVDDLSLARPGGFRLLAQSYPDAALLFCNLLGQHLVGQGEEFERAAWLAGLEPALAGRAWASWHDLASTRRAPDRSAPFALKRAAPLEDVLSRFWHGGELAIHDHECAGLSPESPRQYAVWELSPGHHHLVEWLAVT